ncbi:sulfotransferase [Rickettsiales endosymbiont of Stachyamoeba lipophora]|uniref:sulfotransferase n=1 Tax=Rickettsiales endosymbiont of Stachyamoeba lipophora TaxID=2486578 RepID=UPI000F64DB0E|nr:sulfotransferase [Rickettsiales endosymbiont of Stachyamoeba lipophora]AZL16072.1 hypothetical protein EF513_05930 [Rickettsiales endosymbiont of Stachyamoeba lipophora]
MKVIAIQNFGSSGTTLVHSYLDGHNQILSLPALFGIEFYYRWDKHYQFLSRDKLIAEHLKDFSYFFEADAPIHDIYGLNDMGEDRMQNAAIDRDLYIQHFLASFPQEFTRASFLVSIYQAYNKAMGKDIKDAEFLIFPIHSNPKQYALDLCEDFEKVYFLHMLRNPIQSIGSSIKHNLYNQELFKVNCLESSISQIYKDKPLHVCNYQTHGIVPYCQKDHVTIGALKLEDLHNHKKEALDSICTWLNLRWEDCLMDSTFNNHKWWNRKESIRINGANTLTIQQNHSEFLNEYDKQRLQSIGEHIRLYYPETTIQFQFKKFLKPFQLETNINYYKQRIIILFEKRFKLSTKLLNKFNIKWNFTSYFWPYIWAKDYISIRCTILKARKFQLTETSKIELIYQARNKPSTS